MSETCKTRVTISRPTFIVAYLPGNDCWPRDKAYHRGNATLSGASVVARPRAMTSNTYCARSVDTSMCSFCKTRGASREERQEGMKKDVISHSMYNASPKYACGSSRKQRFSLLRAIPSRDTTLFPSGGPKRSFQRLPCFFLSSTSFTGIGLCFCRSFRRNTEWQISPNARDIVHRGFLRLASVENKFPQIHRKIRASAGGGQYNNQGGARRSHGHRANT